jgi:hypothetical protein
MRAGHGLLLARLPARRDQEAPRWSSPVFLRVTVGQVGFIMGYEQVRSCMHVSWCTYNPRSHGSALALASGWKAATALLQALTPLHPEGGAPSLASLPPSMESPSRVPCRQQLCVCSCAC